MFQLAESTKKSIVNSINWEEFNKNPFINTCWSPYLAVHAKIKGKSVEEIAKSTYIRDSEIAWLTDEWIYDLVNHI